MSEFPAGRCRYCGCSGETCKTADGDLCFWFNTDRTVCSAEACKNAHFRDERREERREAAEAMAALRRVKKRAPWQVHAQIKAEKNRKQRAYRARKKAQDARRGTA
jgi:hypothetical protein